MGRPSCRRRGTATELVFFLLFFCFFFFAFSFPPPPDFFSVRFFTPFFFAFHPWALRSLFCKLSNQTHSFSSSKFTHLGA